MTQHCDSVMLVSRQAIRLVLKSQKGQNMTKAELFIQYHNTRLKNYIRKGMAQREAQLSAKYATEDMVSEISRYEKDIGESYALTLLNLYVEEIQEVVA